MDIIIPPIGGVKVVYFQYLYEDSKGYMEYYFCHKHKPSSGNISTPEELDGSQKCKKCKVELVPVLTESQYLHRLRFAPSRLEKYPSHKSKNCRDCGRTFLNISGRDTLCGECREGRNYEFKHDCVVARAPRR